MVTKGCDHFHGRQVYFPMLVVELITIMIVINSGSFNIVLPIYELAPNLCPRQNSG